MHLERCLFAPRGGDLGRGERLTFGGARLTFGGARLCRIYRQDELQSAVLANEREGLCSLLDRRPNDAQVSASAAPHSTAIALNLRS